MPNDILILTVHSLLLSLAPTHGPCCDQVQGFDAQSSLRLHDAVFILRMRSIDSGSLLRFLYLRQLGNRELWQIEGMSMCPNPSCRLHAGGLGVSGS